MATEDFDELLVGLLASVMSARERVDAANVAHLENHLAGEPQLLRFVTSDDDAGVVVDARQLSTESTMRLGSVSIELSGVIEPDSEGGYLFELRQFEVFLLVSQRFMTSLKKLSELSVWALLPSN